MSSATTFRGFLAGCAFYLVANVAFWAAITVGLRFVGVRIPW